jgi:YHS domain-containing protein
MNFIARVIRFLFWLLIVSWSVALLKRLVGWMLRGGTSMRQPDYSADISGSSGATGISRRLVRDPVCGAHVAEVMAIPLREGGELLHFCSIQCRDEYRFANRNSDVKKIAAHG